MLSAILFQAELGKLSIICWPKTDELLCVRDLTGIKTGVKKRGRPTIPDAELQSIRDHLFWLFDTHWADIGWKLQNLADDRRVPSALSILSPDSPHYAVRLLIMPVQTTSLTRKNFRVLSACIRRLSRNIESTQSAIVQSEKNVQLLDRMLSRKIKDGERSILIGEKRKTVNDLNEERDRLASLQSEQKNVRRELEDAHASFTQSELVKFCRSNRNRLNPRRAANAVAGLPFLSWRQSAMRCWKLETDRAPGGFRYQTFRIVTRIIKAWERKITTRDGTADLVTHARNYLERNRNTPVPVFSDVCKKFRFLRLSIEEVLKEEQALKEKFESGEREYRITSKYFRLSGSSRPELESFLANRESIKRGKIRVRK
jgi:hypothetical protein